MQCNIKEVEDNFQKGLQEYEQTGSPTNLFTPLYQACTNIALSIYHKRGFIIDDPSLVDDTAMRAVFVCMRNITERGHRPEKLSAYCYLRVLAEVNHIDKNKEFLDKTIVELNNQIENGTFENLKEYLND